MFRTKGLPKESGNYVCLLGTYGGLQALNYSQVHKKFNCCDHWSAKEIEQYTIPHVKAWCPIEEFFEAMGWDEEFLKKEEYVHE